MKGIVLEMRYAKNSPRLNDSNLTIDYGFSISPPKSWCMSCSLISVHNYHWRFIWVGYLYVPSEITQVPGTRVWRCNGKVFPLAFIYIYIYNMRQLSGHIGDNLGVSLFAPITMMCRHKVQP